MWLDFYMSDLTSDQPIATDCRLATQVVVYHTQRLANRFGSCWAALLEAKIAECIKPGD